MAPKVTILVPTYNRPTYLREALESALNQTYADCEILIVDDASPTDITTGVQDILALPNVRYIKHKKNLGIAENWKFGFAAAAGEYVCFLEDDDLLEPQFIEVLASVLDQDSTLGVAFASHSIIDEDGDELAADSAASEERFKRTSLPEGPLKDFKRAATVDLSLSINSVLFRRNLIDDSFFHPRAQGASDLCLFYKAAVSGRGAYYVPRRLARYRVHGTSMSSAAPVYMGEGFAFVSEQMLADERLKDLHSEIGCRLRSIASSLALNCLRDRRYDLSAQYARRAADLGASGARIAVLNALVKGRWAGVMALDLMRYAQRFLRRR
jgi:glycosyltransferase involved in cell wall biosynthesis